MCVCICMNDDVCLTLRQETFLFLERKYKWMVYTYRKTVYLKETLYVYMPRKKKKSSIILNEITVCVCVWKYKIEIFFWRNTYISVFILLLRQHFMQCYTIYNDNVEWFTMQIHIHTYTDSDFTCVVIKQQTWRIFIHIQTHTEIY